MSEVYDSLMQGLNEAVDYAQGKETGALVHRIAAPPCKPAALKCFS